MSRDEYSDVDRVVMAFDRLTEVIDYLARAQDRANGIAAYQFAFNATGRIDATAALDAINRADKVIRDAS